VRIWVTGGAGFVGSHLVDRLLVDGHRVDALDDLSAGRFANLSSAREHEGFSFHQIDVTVPELAVFAERIRPEVIVHLAGRVWRPGGFADPMAEARMTVVGVLSVLEAARPIGARVVGVVHATPETDEPPATPAEVSAWTVVDHLRIHRDTLAVETTCVSLANVYGPRQLSDGIGPVVANMIDAAVEGRSLEVHEGDHRRDLLFVDDAVEALVRCIELAPAGVIPVGSGATATPSEIAELIADCFDADDRPTVEAAPARGIDADRPPWPLAHTTATLQWSPWTSLETGLVQTLAARTEGE
jgi:UDP-glucose 4-epimerase